jgi:hypothetical protein
MEAWLNDTDADFSSIPPLYNTLIQQQTRIGWCQLFNGRISTKWACLQDEYLIDRNLQTKKKTGQLWATQIITGIWDGWTLVWTIRNKVIHGHDRASRQHINRLDDIFVCSRCDNPGLSFTIFQSRGVPHDYRRETTMFIVCKPE